MKKIIWISFVCAIAVAASLLIVFYPATLAIFVNGYLVKIPLWLFIVVWLLVWFIFVFLLKFTRVLLFSPAYLMDFFKFAAKKRRVKLLKDMIQASTIEHPEWICKHYAYQLNSDEQWYGAFDNLYWQSLYQTQQYEKLRTHLARSKVQTSDTWQFYQSLVLENDGEYDAAIEYLRALMNKYPKHHRIAQILMRLYTEQGNHQAVLDCLKLARKTSFPDEFKLKTFKTLINKKQTPEEVQELWKVIPKSFKNHEEVQHCFFNQMIQFNAGKQIEDALHKCLLEKLSVNLVYLYLKIDHTKERYEFVKTQWLKEKTSERIFWLLLPLAFRYQDWTFLEQNMDNVSEENLPTFVRAQLYLIRAAAYDHRSMHTQAIDLQTKSQQMLLEQIYDGKADNKE